MTIRQAIELQSISTTNVTNYRESVSKIKRKVTPCISCGRYIPFEGMKIHQCIDCERAYLESQPMEKHKALWNHLSPNREANQIDCLSKQKRLLMEAIKELLFHRTEGDFEYALDNLASVAHEIRKQDGEI